MVVLVAAPGRHKDQHDIAISSQLETIWEEPWAWGTMSDQLRTENTRYSMKMTIYSGRSTRAICKNIIRSCHEACSFSGLALLQSKKGELMATEIKKYYSRRHQRELDAFNKRQAKSAEISENFFAALEAHCAARRSLQISQRLEKLETRLNKILETLQYLCSTSDTTNTTESLAEQAYSVTHRLSRFPDPKHCDFFAHQLRKYSICLSLKQQGLQPKPRPDPLYRRPWPC